MTTGEWAGVLREVFGEFRAPTGVSAGGRLRRGRRPTSPRCASGCGQPGEEIGSRLRMLVGKPGLDGHSNGAEQVAVRARDVGFEVVYQGIRLTPAQIVAAAVQEDVHVVGLSVLSGSHLEVVPAVVDGLRAAGADDVPVVVGGIIPPEDAARPARARRGRGVHAEGLPAHRDDGRDRDAGPGRSGLRDHLWIAALFAAALINRTCLPDARVVHGAGVPLSCRFPAGRSSGGGGAP